MGLPSSQAELLHSFRPSTISRTEQLVLIMLRQKEKQTDPFLACVSYGALQAAGVSPSQRMLGRQIRTTVPTLESKLQPRWPDLQQVGFTDAKTKQIY